MLERQHWGGKRKQQITTHPLCLFVEILRAWLQLRVLNCVSHIPGADNIIADDLSRWDF